MRTMHRIGRMLRVSVALITAVALTPAVEASTEARGVTVPAYERVQLPNGAVMLLMERREVPLIAFNAVIRGGAMDDPPNGSGAASLLAGLLEKGAGERDALEFARTVASVGGSISTGASTEYMSVSGSFLARDQQLMVELLADMLQRPRLAPDQFESLRARQIEFLRAAKDSDLAALTPIYGAAALFADHPYGRPVYGGEASLARLQHADMRRYYEEHVGADRLILAVVGDFKTPQMKRALSEAFGKWRKAQASAPAPTAPRAPERRGVLLIDAPESVQSYFWAGALGVARSDPRRASIDVVNTLFGGRFTSMLNSELRVRTGLSYGASARFDRMQHGGAWQMTSFTQTGKTIEAIDLALATLDKLHSSTIEPALLESGKAYVLGQFPLAFETAAHWSSQLATLEFYGLERSYVEGYAPALASVSAQDAHNIAAGVFPKSNELLIVVIGKAAAIRDALAKYGPVTEMKLSDPSFALE